MIDLDGTSGSIGSAEFVSGDCDERGRGRALRRRALILAGSLVELSFELEAFLHVGLPARGLSTGRAAVEATGATSGAGGADQSGRVLRLRNGACGDVASAWRWRR